MSIDIGKEALRNLSQKLLIKVIAISLNRLACIVVHDRLWDVHGYRAVHISFEVKVAK